MSLTAIVGARRSGFDNLPDDVAKYLLGWLITNVYDIPLWMRFGRRWQPLLRDAHMALVLTRLPHAPSQAFLIGIHRMMTKLRGITELHLDTNSDQLLYPITMMTSNGRGWAFDWPLIHTIIAPNLFGSQLEFVLPQLARVRHVTVRTGPAISSKGISDILKQRAYGTAGEPSNTDSNSVIRSSWNCATCTYANMANQARCHMCDTSAPSDSPSNWLCPTCTYENAAHDPKCDLCNVGRPAAKPAASSSVTVTVTAKKQTVVAAPSLDDIDDAPTTGRKLRLPIQSTQPPSLNGVPV